MLLALSSVSQVLLIGCADGFGRTSICTLGRLSFGVVGFIMRDIKMLLVWFSIRKEQSNSLLSYQLRDSNCFQCNTSLYRTVPNFRREALCSFDADMNARSFPELPILHRLIIRNFVQPSITSQPTHHSLSHRTLHTLSLFHR